MISDLIFYLGIDEDTVISRKYEGIFLI